MLSLLLKKTPKYTTVMLMAGILGAAPFIRDAMIMPALLVLSAVEGLKLVTPAFQITSCRSPSRFMALLFAIQSRSFFSQCSLTYRS